ncbi:MAG: hypothetical protein HOD92_13140 [Deltaproteobacteria bacterium]|nr:hypothetical protein [Deltaproteobacteria bacterium]
MLCSYGEVQPNRQIELIQKLGMPRDATSQNINTAALAKTVAHEMKKQAQR